MKYPTTQRHIDHTRRTLLIAGLAAPTALMAPRPGDAHAQQTPGVGDKEIRLGTWMPMTGPLKAYGVPLRAGIEADMHMINDRGGIKGRKFALTVEDNAYNAQRTLAIARKLVTRDDVYAIVAPLGTAQTAAAFDYLFGEAKVPLLNPYGGTVNWYVPPRENLYGVQAPYEGQARALGRWAMKDGHKSLIVLHTALMGYDNVAVHVAPGAKSLRPDAAVELFGTKFGATDYGPISLDLIQKKPDAVVLIVAQGEVIAASKELRTQGYKGDLYTYSPSVSSCLLELGGAALEGIKSVSWIVPVTTNNAAVKEYRDALAKYSPGEKPD